MRLFLAASAVGVLTAGSAYAQSPSASAPAPIVVPAGCHAVGTGANMTISCDAPGAKPPVPATPPPTYQAPPAGPQTGTHEETRWYGWQTLLVDGAIIVTTVAIGAGARNAGAATLVFAGGYLFGGPIVHWANGQVGKGFGSLGIRLGLPLVGGIAGGFLGGAAGDYQGFDDFAGSIAGLSLGVFVGGAAAIALDAGLLARKTVTVDNAATSRLRLRWQPTASYDPHARSMQVGLGGTF